MLQFVTTLVTLLVLLVLPSHVAALKPYDPLGGKSYDLTGIPPNDPSTSGGKRVVSTATNSPIYYISKLDLSSLFTNLFPHESQKIGPLLQNRPDLLAGSGNRRPTPRPITQAPPFKRIPLPFVSNAKPVGSYKLKPTRRPTTAIPETTMPPTMTSTTAEPVANYPQSSPAPQAIDTTPAAVPTTTIRPWWWFTTPTTTPAPTTTTTTAATTTTPSVETTTTTTTIRPWWFTTIATTPAAIQRYTPSKIIRLKTKFISNGQPSSVYLFKSSSRRYSLQDILWRPPFDEQESGNALEQLPSGLQRRTGSSQRRTPVHYRKPAPFYSKTKRPPTRLFQ